MQDNFTTYILRKKNEDIDSFLWNHGTLFHTYDFLTAVGNQYECLVVESADGEIVAALPLVKSRKHFLEAYHRPPYTYQFGPVIHGKHDQSRQAIIRAICANLPPSGHYDFKLFMKQEDITAFQQSHFSIKAQQTFVIKAEREFGPKDLTPNKRRRLTKLFKSEKSKQIKCLENQDSNLELIEQLWQKTAARAKFPIHEKIFHAVFHADLEHYSNVVIDNKGNPVSASFCLLDQRNMYHMVSASIRMDDKLLNVANILSLYRSILYAQQKKLNFDTEGSTIPGVAQYYREMGAIPTSIYRAQKSTSLYYRIIRWLAKIKRSL